MKSRTLRARPRGGTRCCGSSAATRCGWCSGPTRGVWAGLWSLPEYDERRRAGRARGRLAGPGRLAAADRARADALRLDARAAALDAAAGAGRRARRSGARGRAAGRAAGSPATRRWRSGLPAPVRKLLVGADAQQTPWVGDGPALSR
ncbi:MAG: hypothetical protein MZW92_62895 [Comamonadaceae bacterium]|nr:hypothetical protein [Comamonadaceae bacterium]